MTTPTLIAIMAFCAGWWIACMIFDLSLGDNVNDMKHLVPPFWNEVLMVGTVVTFLTFFACATVVFLRQAGVWS